MPSAKTATTLRGLVALWPSSAALAGDLALPHPTVYSWLQRDNIPVPHWRGVIASARGRGIRGVTEARLVTILGARHV